MFGGFPLQLLNYVDSFHLLLLLLFKAQINLGTIGLRIYSYFRAADLYEIELVLLVALRNLLCILKTLKRLLIFFSGDFQQMILSALVSELNLVFFPILLKVASFLDENRIRP